MCRNTSKPSQGFSHQYLIYLFFLIKLFLIYYFYSAITVTLYAFPMKEIEEIDIDKEWKELKEFENEINEIENKIEIYLREIEWIWIKKN